MKRVIQITLDDNISADAELMDFLNRVGRSRLPYTYLIAGWQAHQQANRDLDKPQPKPAAKKPPAVDFDPLE